MSRSKPQRDYIFYLDECLGGNKVYSALARAGVNVELHSAHFKRGTPDEEWLRVIGEKQWVLLTQDKRIKYRKNEILALRSYCVRAFIVVARGLRGEEIGQLIIDSMPKVLRILKNTHPPLVAVISRSSVVELREGRPRYDKT